MVITFEKYVCLPTCKTMIYPQFSRNHRLFSYRKTNLKVGIYCSKVDLTALEFELLFVSSALCLKFE